MEAKQKPQHSRSRGVNSRSHTPPERTGRRGGFVRPRRPPEDGEGSLQPCYDTCTSIVRYSIILGLNTLIGWRAYFNTRQAVGGSGERGVLEDRFARKIPLSRQPRPRGHQSASFSPSVLHARTHGHDDKPWPAGLRGTSKYFEKVIVDGKHRSTCASSAVVAPGQPFRFSGNKKTAQIQAHSCIYRAPLIARAGSNKNRGIPCKNISWHNWALGRVWACERP